MASRELSILVTAKNQASRVLGEVRGEISGIERASSTMRTAIGTGIGFLGAQVVSRAASGLSGLVTGALNMNASLETSQLQFETLMGSADEAQAHVESLFKFAAQTPFETAPIIEASRLMHTFGGEALNNMENLTLFGDAAAATSTEINEVAFWSSRMYAAIQAGRPFGEAAQRLNELGILTPQVRTELEDMQKSGASGIEVWQRYQTELGRFDGAMERQADSWAGLTSSIKDNISILGATTFRPLFDTLKVGMKDLLAFLSTPEAQKSAEEFAANLAKFINPENLRDVAESTQEALVAAVGFVKDIPWGTVADAVSIMGGGARVAMDAFLAAPPWLQTAIITGWGLNKLTGGALGTIVGALGSGLVKGVLGMNAGVVNINAATVNSPDGKLPTGGGGKFPLIPVAGALAAPLALSGSDNPSAEMSNRQIELTKQIEQGAITSAEAARLWMEAYGQVVNNPFRVEPPDLSLLGESFARNIGYVLRDTNLGAKLLLPGFSEARNVTDRSSMDAAIQPLTTSINGLRDSITRQTDLTQASEARNVTDRTDRIFVDSVKLDPSQVTDLREPTAAAFKQLVTLTVEARAADQANRTSNSFITAEMSRNRAETRERLTNLAGKYDIQNANSRTMLDRAAFQTGLLSGIRDSSARTAAKNFSPTVVANVAVTSSVTVNDWQRTLTSAIRAVSPTSPILW